VGGAQNAEREDIILVYELGGAVWRDPAVPVLQRNGGGFVLGSASVFLVLESREHATARGARLYGKLSPVHADRRKRVPGAIAAALGGMMKALGPAGAVVSGNTGFGTAAAEEAAVLAEMLPQSRVVLSGDMIGHGMEAQFPFGVALAAAGVAAGKLAGGVVVTSVGHHRGEGAVKVEAA
jgi:3-oxoacyl-[acyl-carrier-protein] synthase II